MEPIHQAAYDGDVAAIDRLVAEDGRRLNAQLQAGVTVEGWDVEGCTPLMLAAWKGHDAAVARLLALGADVGLSNARGSQVAYNACKSHRASTLELLLDASVSFNARDKNGWTPVMHAANCIAIDCVKLLLARGGNAVELDAQLIRCDSTALHWALRRDANKKSRESVEIVQLLLQAGADPTIRDNRGKTALETARIYNRHPCILLLEAAVAEPPRSRLLFEARALLDADHATNKARADAQTKGQPAAVQQQEAMAAAPVYLKQRVAQAQELPRVAIQQHNHDDEEQEKLAACVKYALGLEGGGIVLAEGQEPTVGMLPELLVELLVPKSDPARKGRPLGEGV